MTDPTAAAGGDGGAMAAADAIAEVFRATAQRYGVKYLTSLMTMTALEAIVPNAPEDTKLAVVRQLEGFRGCVGEEEFSALVRFAKAATWMSHDDVREACVREVQRQTSQPSRETLIPIMPAVSVTTDLRAELAARDAIIEEQRATIWELQERIAQLQAPQRIEVALLEERCHRAEQELALARARMQAMHGTPRAVAAATAAAMASPAPPPQPSASAVTAAGRLKLNAAASAVAQPFAPMAAASGSARMVADTISPMSAWITMSSMERAVPQSFIASRNSPVVSASASPYAMTPVRQFGPSMSGEPLRTPTRVDAAGAFGGPSSAAASGGSSKYSSSTSVRSAVYHLCELEKRTTLDTFVYGRPA